MGVLDTIDDVARGLGEQLENVKNRTTAPTVRLGVTGLSRAGKTVFISALLHNLIHYGRLPLFEAHAGGRIASAQLQPQPDDDVPTFDYRAHIKDLTANRIWPQSTRQISEIRLTLTFESESRLARIFKASELHLDIVDYPGEWLLDLTLLNKDFEDWSANALDLANGQKRAELADPFLAFINGVSSEISDLEAAAQQGSKLFTDYLQACRAEDRALSMLPPGRFLMPGDLAGSPAVTFMPLPASFAENVPEFYALNARRYDAYKRHVVKPFFENHFAKLDRQIVLVDVLSVLNAGPDAIRDLEMTLGDILSCFRPGRRSWLAGILGRRVDRILFAATKADHLHHADHDRLEAILDHLLSKGRARARTAGAETETLALAAIRATREAFLDEKGERLPAVLGTPLEGQKIDGKSYDGKTEIALFPGDLPDDPEKVYELEPGSGLDNPLSFLRFKPPALEETAEGTTLSLPHIRLDRALQFLLGDKLT